MIKGRISAYNIGYYTQHGRVARLYVTEWPPRFSVYCYISCLIEAVISMLFMNGFSIKHIKYVTFGLYVKVNWFISE